MGTLESTGLNRTGQTSAPCRDLGMNSMGDNADTSPNTSRGTASNPNSIPSPLVNAVNTSNDTSMYDVPEGGTVESQGINGG